MSWEEVNVAKNNRLENMLGLPKRLTARNYTQQ